jgi:acyl-CoA reductase-like NAD-dependent aldehyde dehydrogenase
VTLLSAEAASAHAGPGWFAELIAAARAEVPDAAFDAYLDCADRPGDALAAFRRGVPGAIFTGRADVADKLADLAAAHGIPLLRARPAGLDLLDRPSPEAAVRAHLNTG